MQNDPVEQDQKNTLDDAKESAAEETANEADPGDTAVLSEAEETANEADPGDTAVLSEAEFTDNVGDVSVEINIEELVKKVEAEQNKDASAKKAIRQRLEDIAEDKDFESTYAIEFDNE
jgi:predicted FMN-binding regulatory protein PaiB